jgi:protein gp37
MVAADWHTYQVLTKRSERLRDMLRGPLRFAADRPHIWWGVSVEDRKHGLPRVEHLQSAPAGLRMLSVEPLLEDLGPFDLDGIGWVIAGGESGPGARPLDPDWIRAVRDRCDEADVPFFFKQWGGVRKGKTGRLLDGRTHDAMPDRPTAAVPALAERRRLAADSLAGS